MSFKDKVVIVTGASSGIGAATAVQFASQGAKVVIVGRNVEKLKNVTEKCEKSGAKPLVIVAEMTNDDDVKRIVSTTVSHFGKLDILVNNAGISNMSFILQASGLDVYDKIYATNLRAVVLLTNLAVPHLIETKGNIVNISSVAGLKVLAEGMFAYSALKTGLDHFTRCVALDLSSKGVRVNAVNPGPVKTDIITNSGMVDNMAAEAVWEQMGSLTALNRASEPEETADLILFLASDKAEGITGSCYVSDNGMLLKNGLM